MNYNEEPYPKDLESLFKKANAIAVDLNNNLNNGNCKRLNELYKIINNKTYRQKDVFNELGYIDNKSESRKKNEFKGIYVFGEEKRGEVIPVYVGISRTIYRRLRQHGWGKLHSECTLAYLITIAKNSNSKKKNSRNAITNEEMLHAKEQIQNYKVALYVVPEDFDLYFLEVALAGIFKTKWNSFRTH